MDIQFPSAGSFLETFKSLSESIHAQDWMRDSEGDIIIPYDMDAPQKRFLVRYFKATRRGVVIADVDGTLRPPTDAEVETPPQNKRAKV